MPMTYARTCVWLLAALLATACAAPQQSDDGRSDADVASDADVTSDADVAAVDVVQTDTQPADVALTAPALCRPAIAQPSWFHRAVGYEVFVRSFADSNGDGIGDFAGLTQKLDYLNDGKPGGTDLGIDLIWLMPVNDSPSYHGYDVRNYRTLQPDYGTDADFDAFLAAAHARGIRVVLDLVLNHTSNQHPWFQASAAGTDHTDWYVWSATQLPWKQPFGNALSWHKSGNRWYYGVFSAGMPDLNYQSAAVTAEMTDVAKTWLDRGVDGFRLDAVRYLIETGAGAGQKDTQPTLDWWTTWATALRAHQTTANRPEPLLLGEAWAANAIAAKYHAGGAGLNMTFDFDLASALVGDVQAGDADVTAQVVCGEESLFGASGARGTFLTNHDMVRVATQVGDPALLPAAAVLLFSLPGTPWVYYGEELGLRNGADAGDEAKRQPMPWHPGPGVGFTTGTPWQAPNADAAEISVAVELAQPTSLLALYRQLIGLRKSSEALSVGETRLLRAGPLVGVLRQAGAERVLALVNLGPTAQAIPWTAAQLGPTSPTDLLAGGAAVSLAGLVLPAHGVRVLRL